MPVEKRWQRWMGNHSEAGRGDSRGRSGRVGSDSVSEARRQPSAAAKQIVDVSLPGKRRVLAVAGAAVEIW
jgi:hypothetical protein